MAHFIKLKNPPIKEIIFTISFNENIPLEKLDEFKGLPEIVAKFNVVNQGFNMKVEAIGNLAPVPTAQLDGYLLRCLPDSRIIQARRGSFSLHKVEGYESFESLLAEFKSYWNLLIKVTGGLTVNNLSVRYVNFIAEKEGESVGDLLSIKSTHPFGNQLEGYLIQYKFKYDRASEIEVNVVAAKGKDGGIDGTVLDIILNRPIGNEQNNEHFFDVLAGMRQAKNDLFFRSITEKAIQKFNE